MKAAAVLVALILLGCANRPRMPLGAPAEAPIGAVLYCAHHPDDELCKPTP